MVTRSSGFPFMLHNLRQTYSDFTDLNKDNLNPSSPCSGSINSAMGLELEFANQKLVFVATTVDSQSDE